MPTTAAALFLFLILSHPYIAMGSGVAFVRPSRLVSFETFEVEDGMPWPLTTAAAHHVAIAVLDFPAEVCIPRQDHRPSVQAGRHIAILTNSGGTSCRFVAIIRDLAWKDLLSTRIWATVVAGDERQDKSSLDAAYEEAQLRDIEPLGGMTVAGATVDDRTAAIAVRSPYELMHHAGVRIQRHVPEDQAFAEAYLVPPENSFRLEIPVQRSK